MYIIGLQTVLRCVFPFLPSPPPHFPSSTFFVLPFVELYIFYNSADEDESEAPVEVQWKSLGQIIDQHIQGRYPAGFHHNPFAFFIQWLMPFLTSK